MPGPVKPADDAGSSPALAAMRILGFKTLRLSDNSIRSIARPGIWYDGSLEAACMDIRYDERGGLYSHCDWDKVPGFDCSCGIWAVSPYPDLAHQYLSVANRFVCVIQGIDKTLRTKNKYNFRHQGFRSKKAKIIALLKPDDETYAKNLNVYYVPPLNEIYSMVDYVQNKLDVPIIPMDVALAMVQTNYEEWENRNGGNW